MSEQVEGIGYDFIPTVLDRNLADFWVKSTDKVGHTRSRRHPRSHPVYRIILRFTEWCRTAGRFIFITELRHLLYAVFFTERFYALPNGAALPDVFIILPNCIALPNCAVIYCVLSS